MWRRDERAGQAASSGTHGGAGATLTRRRDLLAIAATSAVLSDQPHRSPAAVGRAAPRSTFSRRTYRGGRLAHRDLLASADCGAFAGTGAARSRCVGRTAAGDPLRQ